MRTRITISREDDTWYTYIVEMQTGAYGRYEKVRNGRAVGYKSAKERAIEDAKSYLRELWIDDIDRNVIRMNIGLEDVR